MVLFVYICKQEVIAKVKRKNQKKSLINVLTAAVLCVCTVCASFALDAEGMPDRARELPH